MSKIYDKTENRFFIKSLIGALLINTQPHAEDVTDKERENVLVVRTHILSADPTAPNIAATLHVRLPAIVTESIRNFEINRLVFGDFKYIYRGNGFADRHQQQLLGVVAAISNELDLDVVSIEFNLVYSKEEIQAAAKLRRESLAGWGGASEAFTGWGGEYETVLLS